MRKKEPGKKNAVLSLLLKAISLALLVMIGITFLQTNSLKRQFEQEVQVTPVPTLSPPPLFARPTEALLRLGSVSPDVKKLQERLKELGFYSGEIDGQYGGGTKEAVRVFQSQHGLQADGMAGQTTLSALYGADAKKIVVTPEPALPRVSKKDAPLLVNRTHPLPEDYQAPDLIPLSEVLKGDLVIIKQEGEQGCRAAAEAIKIMLEAAHRDGLKEWQVSEGYRTGAEQAALFEARKQQYISGEATGDKLSEQTAEKETEREVARPGTSEHQTGLAFDITVPGRSFGDTQQARWLAENCGQYGFIIRYPEGRENVTGFRYEPWHIRFVGSPHSQYIMAADITLEEYLERLP